MRKQSKCIAMRNAYLKYGKESFKIEKIDSANSYEDLNKKEIEYIAKYCSTDRDKGYNLDLGGNNSALSKKTKDKISASVKQVVKTKEYLDKQRSVWKKRKADTSKMNLWLTNQGYQWFNVWKAKKTQNGTRSQPSIWIKEDYVGKWINKSDCLEQLNIANTNNGKDPGGHIGKCLKGKRNQHKGYIFEYCKELMVINNCKDLTVYRGENNE